MIIPYTVFLGLYLLGVLFVLVYALVTLLHVMRLSRLASQAVAVTFIFIAGILLILFMSYHSLSRVNWQGSISIGTDFPESARELSPL
ncbi:MAG TPA: hypothetical protein VJA28_02915 [Patescibacteria group bacterium]|nr:hypothetical protein [Patescibacteria group bacterium]